MSPANRGSSRLGASHDPDNPLSPFRMSMLAHGFVDDGGQGYRLDEDDRGNYSVIRVRGGRVPVGTLVVLMAVVMVLVAVAIFG